MERSVTWERELLERAQKGLSGTRTGERKREGNGTGRARERVLDGLERPERACVIGNGNAGTETRERERAPGTENGMDSRKGFPERMVWNGMMLLERERNGLHGAGVIMGGWSGGVRVRADAWMDGNGAERMYGGPDGLVAQLFVKLLFCE